MRIYPKLAGALLAVAAIVGDSAALPVAAIASDVVEMRAFAPARQAIEVDDRAALVAILDGGLSPNAASPEDGYTLLHIAASNGRVAMVRELLRRGADPAARTPRYGFTPVDSAGNNVAILDMLIAAGGPRPVGYRVSTPTPTPTRVGPRSVPAAPAAAAKKKPQSAQDKECEAKHYADIALCSDTSCRMRTYGKWQQCLKTGRYW